MSRTGIYPFNHIDSIFGSGTQITAVISMIVPVLIAALCFYVYESLKKKDGVYTPLTDEYRLRAIFGIKVVAFIAIINIAVQAKLLSIGAQGMLRIASTGGKYRV